MELAACLFKMTLSCLVPWGCHEGVIRMPFACVLEVWHRVPWDSLCHRGALRRHEMPCGVMGIPYKWDRMPGGTLEVPHRCHWGAFGVSLGAL